MIRKKCQILNKLGVHARAAAKLVHLAAKYESHIELTHHDRVANAKSIMGVMMLGAAYHNWIEIQVHGLDEEKALTELLALINNRFGEEQ
jgi:phosphocarrier protein